MDAAESFFRKIPFDEALKEAKKEKKIVFVDFYTTWCGPCKMLNRTTWKDQRVIKWLSDETIPLKIDAEEKTKLAARYRVTGYPTLMFIDHNGGEIGRIVGYRPPDKFLKEAEQHASGLDATEIFQKKIEGEGARNPKIRMDYGDLLIQTGDNAKALEQYLWAYDNGAKNNRSFQRMRSTILLRKISIMGRSFKPAIDALQQRRDSKTNALLESDVPDKLVLDDILRLNEVLGEPEANLVLYDRLVEKKTKPEIMEPLVATMFDALLEAKRYENLAQYQDKMIQQSLQQMKALNQRLGNKPELASGTNRYFLDRLTRHYQVWVGVGNGEKAAALASQILKSDDSANTYNLLAANGLATGKPIEDNLKQARKAFELSEGKKAAYIENLARIMTHMGRAEAALKLIEENKPNFREAYDLRILDRADRLIRKKAAE